MTEYSNLPLLRESHLNLYFCVHNFFVGVEKDSVADLKRILDLNVHYGFCYQEFLNELVDTVSPLRNLTEEPHKTLTVFAGYLE